MEGIVTTLQQETNQDHNHNQVQIYLPFASI